MNPFEVKMAEFIQAEMQTDTAHDFQHVLRVIKSARMLCAKEQGNIEVVLPAAWLHDCLTLTKDHPQRALSSKLAADKAIDFLAQIGYPKAFFEPIHHAIIAHSFSANITPLTLEAKIVQDADRLDALGAIGVARCIQVSAQLKQNLYCPEDPFCHYRKPNDRLYTLDHFYQKLLSIGKSMCTESGRIEAMKRNDFMYQFIRQLNKEITVNDYL
ncbi:MAG: hypothetical protein ACI9C4_000652 [Paraglaciecola sp.]